MARDGIDRDDGSNDEGADLKRGRRRKPRPDPAVFMFYRPTGKARWWRWQTAGNRRGGKERSAGRWRAMSTATATATAMWGGRRKKVEKTAQTEPAQRRGARWQLTARLAMLPALIGLLPSLLLAFWLLAPGCLLLDGDGSPFARRFSDDPSFLLSCRATARRKLFPPPSFRPTGLAIPMSQWSRRPRSLIVRPPKAVSLARLGLLRG
jgi:hypothetical protein